jgi:phosphatidylserine synthase
MEKSPGNVIRRNLANAASILGVLPMGLLFLEDGYQFLIPFIIFNNVMDDFDGVLARWLKIGSQLGANLDNVCDTVVHVALVLLVGAHYGWPTLIVGMIAATAVTLRLTGRLDFETSKCSGSPTNELIRHMLFVLLLAEGFSFHPVPYLILLFVLHSVTMLVPFQLPILIRGMAKSATAIALVNALLLVAWLAPILTPWIASAFFATYLYSFAVGGGRWLSGKKDAAL